MYVEPLHKESEPQVGFRGPTCVSDTGSGDTSDISFSSKLVNNMHQGRGGFFSGQGGNGRGFPARNNRNTQPNRAFDNGRQNGNEHQSDDDTLAFSSHPYVAPHRRNFNLNVKIPSNHGSDLDPEIRPSSSVSNQTFASQIPYQRSNVGSNADTGRSFPSGEFVYGQHPLTDPFVDTQHSSLPPNYFGGKTAMMAPSFSNNNRAQPASMHAPTSGQPFVINNTNAPMASSHNDAQSPFGNHGAQPHQGSNGFRTPPNNANAFGPNGIPSTNSSGNDSGLANAKAIRLANMIRAGAADDPTDIDYGNPGRSRRLPPEPVNLVEEQLPKRGKIGNSNNVMKMPMLDNTKGSAAAFIGTEAVPLPAWFYELSQGYLPTVEEVFAALPVVSACVIVVPTTAGVIKITNIPYAISSSEVVAFLGRNVGIVSQPEGSPYHAVHIVMDRFTGKTMDAYVELKNAKEVAYVVGQFEKRTQNGRQAKLGDRAVKVEAATQAELQATIFPNAKNVVWEGGVPKIDNVIPYYYENRPSSGFAGFLQAEEMTALTKYAETPSRVSILSTFDMLDPADLHSLHSRSAASSASTRISSPSCTSTRGSRLSTSLSVSVMLSTR